MEIPEVNEAEAEYAFSLSKAIVSELERKEIEPTIIQAALGTAWFASCEMLGWDKEFVIDLVEKNYTEQNDIQDYLAP